uniref:Phosphate uptake regulator PhoU n=1 Tax=Geoglobus ahangari TaxID=113653 RepID=A0A7C3YEI6_9EURY
MKDVRKIFKSGKGSYILTLPKIWIIENGLKEGDSVYLNIKRNKLLISPSNIQKMPSKMSSIDDEDLDFNQVLRRIIAYYLAGYNSLKVRTYNDEQRRAVAFASDMLIGVEIMEDLGEVVTLEIYLDSRRINLNEIVERMSRVCKSMLSDFRKMIKSFKREIGSSIIVRENEIDKLYFLTLRLINNAVWECLSENEILEVFNYRIFARALERTADHIDAMVESLINLGKAYPEFCDIIEKCEELFGISTNSFFKKDISAAEDVLNNAEIYINHIIALYTKILSYEKEEILNLKTILDGLQRIIGYSSDIAEVTINASVLS